HVHALGGEVLARGAHVLGGDAQARTLVHGGLVIEAFGGGHAEAAAGDVQVGGLVQAARVLRHVLVQHILAGDAEVGRAVLDVGGHVGGAHDDDAQVVGIRGQDQLARGFRVLGYVHAGGGQQ